MGRAGRGGCEPPGSGALGHPFTCLGLLSLAVFHLTLHGPLPLAQPWRALLLPAYLLQVLLAAFVFMLLPFAREPVLVAMLAYVAVVLPLYVGVLLGLDTVLVWREAGRR